ncbi:NAD(P)H-dependent oxidoreductase [Mesonia sp. K7]|uniref:NAD(P)H-dependent oxidoreductase n=1 Tax=Mesonia sp. K7 TaxID=2218606 RepID=UPI000DAA0C8C|nr:NAD(P)H-dependent oxidoreductase [Mesonia sp. K7]PZD79364.1 NAD(P)H-dependent oxidoreductase [Mesonia sp. K7]
MNSIEALNWRYATKKFDAETLLPESKIDTLKHAFRLTATSYGLQPMKLLVIQDKNAQQKIQTLCMNQQQIGTASHLLILCTVQNINEDFIEKYFTKVKQIRNTPDKIIQPFQDFLTEDFKEKTKQEIETWAVNQVYLAMGNLLTVCAQEKIDACPMEGFQQLEINRFLELEKLGLSAALLLPVGIRAADDIFADFKKVRKPLEEIVIDWKNQ